MDKFIFEHELSFGIMTYCQLLLFANLISLPFLIVTNSTNHFILVCMLIFLCFAVIGVLIFLFMAYKMKDMKWINYFTNPSVQIVSTGLVLLAGLIIRQDMIVVITFLTSILICIGSAEYLVAVVVKWKNPEYLEFPSKEAVEAALVEMKKYVPQRSENKFYFFKRKVTWVLIFACFMIYVLSRLAENQNSVTLQKIYALVGIFSLLVIVVSSLMLLVQYVLYRKKKGNKR